MTTKEIYTDWSKASVDPHKALMGLVSCLDAGRNAWIECRKNGDQKFPVMKKNPQLDNPFNWTAYCGVPRSEEELKKRNYFNETERDLSYNWVQCFGEKEAIEEYQKNGVIKKGLILSGGIPHPVKIEDADLYRSKIAGDHYKNSFWSYMWKPKDGVPFYVLDESIGNVFVVCYKEEPVEKVEALRKAAAFLSDMADFIEEGR